MSAILSCLVCNAIAVSTQLKCQTTQFWHNCISVPYWWFLHPCSNIQLTRPVVTVTLGTIVTVVRRAGVVINIPAYGAWYLWLLTMTEWKEPGPRHWLTLKSFMTFVLMVRNYIDLHLLILIFYITYVYKLYILADI